MGGAELVGDLAEGVGQGNHAANGNVVTGQNGGFAFRAQPLSYVIGSDGVDLASGALGGHAAVSTSGHGPGRLGRGKGRGERGLS